MRHATTIATSMLFLAFLASAASGLLPAADAPRNLVVYFEFLDNGNGVEEAVDYLFKRMLGPDDQLIIQSPVRTYGFSRTTLSQSREKLSAMVKKKLRGDIARAAQNYKQVLKNLDTAAREIEELAYPSGTLDTTKDMNELFILYRLELANLNQLRKVNDASLRRLAGVFQGQKGENHLVMLFEREFRPIPKREALNVLADMPKFAVQSNELFATGDLTERFDVTTLADHFKRLPLTQHFIYITSKNVAATGSLFENSGDIYAAFSKITRITGGTCITTAEPVAGLEKIVKSWEKKTTDVRRQ